MRMVLKSLCMLTLAATLVEAQAAPPARIATSAFAGFMAGSELPGYGAGLSLRRMKEGSSVDFAVDGAYYVYESYDAGADGEVTPTVIAVTGTVIWQVARSRVSLLGGYGMYRFNFGSSVGAITATGPHVGVGVRLTNRLGLEVRSAVTKAEADGFTFDIPLQPLLLRFAF